MRGAHVILQALVRLYEELGRQGKAVPEGWSVGKVTHRLVLDRDGNLKGILPCRKKVQRGKKEAEIPLAMNVPEQAVKSSGVKSNFLCENSGYFLGIDDKGKPERTAECFAAAGQLHHKILDGCPSETARAILKFFDRWDIAKAKLHPCIKDDWEDLVGASNFVFQVEGKDALDDEAIRNAWEKYRNGSDEAECETGQCLVTGKTGQKIALLHPKIKGVMGAQSSGANLVSFNADAFCSYGHDGEQGKNAPVSEQAAFAYGTALNYLLADKKHVKVLGDTTVVYWSEKANEACQDCVLAALGDDSGLDDAALDDIMQRMRDGVTAHLQDLEIDPEEPFYILGLAPSAARLSVRFFLRNTFGDLMRNIGAHQERMRLCAPPWEKQRIPLWRTLKATVNPHSKDSASSPLLAGSLLRSLFLDANYPEAVFQNIMMRIFSGRDETGEGGKGGNQKIDYVKAAFIKAYLVKNGAKHWEEELQMAVNENCSSIPYVLGRLFSVLENIQQSANPSINTTIKDRYFNAACATPASTFPVLLKLVNAHLGKLKKASDKQETAKRIYFEKKLQELLGKIEMPDAGMPLPKRLTLEEQGAFVLGYYQETQARYAGKKEEA